MNKTFLYPFFLAAAVALPSKSLANDVSQAWEEPHMPVDFAVPAGAAPIEQALSTIIPAPYRIELDKTVPSSAVIVWPAGDDWIKVLRAAVAPLDLYVQADWANNVVRIVQSGPRVRPMFGNDGARMPSAAAGDLPSDGSLAAASGMPEKPATAAKPAPAGKPWPQLRPGALPLIESQAPAPKRPTPIGAATLARAPVSKLVVPAVQPVKASTTTAPAKRAPVPAVPVWTAKAGDTLRGALAGWSDRAGWSLRWEATGIDYSIVAPLHFNGSFVDATSHVISAYAHAEKPLWVCLYLSQRLARVTAAPCAQ